MICFDTPRPDTSRDMYQPQMEKATHFARQMDKNGVVRDVSYRQDRPGVAILTEAGSVDAASSRFGAVLVTHPNAVAAGSSRR